MTEKGFGKRTRGSDYRPQKRGGSGNITIRSTEKNGLVVGLKHVNDEDDLILISDSGNIIRIEAKGIPITGRNTQGVKLIVISPDEKLVSIARLADNGND